MSRNKSNIVKPKEFAYVMSRKLFKHIDSATKDEPGTDYQRVIKYVNNFFFPAPVGIGSISDDEIYTTKTHLITEIIVH